MDILAVMLMSSALTEALATQTAPVPPDFSVGDCVSARMAFSQDEIYDLAGADTQRYTIDRSEYNFTLDFGSISNALEGGIDIHLDFKGDNVTAAGTRISTTRYMLYGRVTARFMPTTATGAITSFITWSDSQTYLPAFDTTIQDEIDIEILGSDPGHPQTNLFSYLAKNPELGRHGGPISSDINPNAAHNYTIDWRRDRIVWEIDGVAVRTLLRNQSFAVNSVDLPINTTWFPETPSRVQFAIWDGSITQRDWAGGPLPWNGKTTLTSSLEWVDVQCYDNNDRPVERWSADGSGSPQIDITDIPALPMPTPSKQTVSNDALSKFGRSSGMVVMFVIWTGLMAFMV